MHYHHHSKTFHASTNDVHTKTHLASINNVHMLSGVHWCLWPVYVFRQSDTQVQYFSQWNYLSIIYYNITGYSSIVFNYAFYDLMTTCVDIFTFQLHIDDGTQSVVLSFLHVCFFFLPHLYIRGLAQLISSCHATYIDKQPDPCHQTWQCLPMNSTHQRAFNHSFHYFLILCSQVTFCSLIIVISSEVTISLFIF